MVDGNVTDMSFWAMSFRVSYDKIFLRIFVSDTFHNSYDADMIFQLEGISSRVKNSSNTFVSLLCLWITVIYNDSQSSSFSNKIENDLNHCHHQSHRVCNLLTRPDQHPDDLHEYVTYILTFFSSHMHDLRREKTGGWRILIQLYFVLL